MKYQKSIRKKTRPSIFQQKHNLYMHKKTNEKEVYFYTRNKCQNGKPKVRIGVLVRTSRLPKVVYKIDTTNGDMIFI